MKLIDRDTKEEIKIGDTAITFRGEKVIVTYFHPPHKPGSTGKISVMPESEDRHNTGASQLFYPSVINAEYLEE